MVKLGTFLLATVAVAVSATIAQAADIELGPGKVRSAAYHHRHWHGSGRCALVQGVRGGTPLSVPFFADGWGPGPVYEVGWQHCTCYTAAGPAISAMY